MLSGCGGADGQESDEDQEEEVQAVPVEVATVALDNVHAAYAGTTTLEADQEADIVANAAILEGGRSRLRPIVMTTLTTTLGLLPLAIGMGEGAEVRAPLAISVIGGLLFSTLLTLVLIPVMYDLLDRRARRRDPGVALASSESSLPTIYVTLDDLRVWGGERARGARMRAARLLPGRLVQ